MSSGKSLVLETIVGRGLLPRSLGIVTTRQLVLQLHSMENRPQDYARFLHMPKCRLTDFCKLSLSLSTCDACTLEFNDMYLLWVILGSCYEIVILNNSGYIAMLEMPDCPCLLWLAMLLPDIVK